MTSLHSRVMSQLVISWLVLICEMSYVLGQLQNKRLGVTVSLQSAVMMKGKTGHGHEPWDFSLLFNVSPIHHKYTLTTFVCRTITLLHSCSGQQPPAPHPYNNGNTDAK